jgi:hypothetical protein
MNQRKIDLLAPKKPGEPEYDNLALTRLFTVIRFDMIAMIVGMAVAVAVLLGSLGVFMKVTWDRDTRDKHRQCLTSNVSRAAIKDALGDLYDGFVVSSKPADKPAAEAFKAEHMGTLEKKLPQRQC